MVTSTQLTNKINNSPDPLVAEFNIWKNTRYLVSQSPASSDYSETVPGYFEGRFVIPGPKCNVKLSDGLGIPTLTINDFQNMKNQYFIRFTDNATTDNASEDIQRAIFTVMSNDEADRYEKELTKYYESKRVHRKAVK